MSSETDSWMFGAFAIGMIVMWLLLSLMIIGPVSEQRDMAYDKAAQLGCPLMQYNNLDKLICIGTKTIPVCLKYSELDCRGIRYCEEYYGNKTITECVEYVPTKENFITGRYIEGKIQCINGYIPPEDCAKWKNIYECKKMVSQNYTLEEFGLR
jgi:hypothetical protein